MNTPVLVLVDTESTSGASLPTAASAEVVAAAHALTEGDVAALALSPVSDAGQAALEAAGASVLVAADLGERAHLACVAADALRAAVQVMHPGLVILPADYRGKEVAGALAIALGSAALSDAADLRAQEGPEGLEVSGAKLILSGSWGTRAAVRVDPEHPGIVTLRPGSVELPEAVGAALAGEGAVSSLQVCPLEVTPSAASAATTLVERRSQDAAAGPDLTQARTVVVGGRGVDGDFDLVRSLAQPLEAAVGATRVACDEGWIDRSAQVGQTGVSISPRLYIGLGVSGAVHHTCGIQGAQTIVAICDDSEAPIFEMADFGVVGDVTTVVPDLLAALRELNAVG